MQRNDDRKTWEPMGSDVGRVSDVVQQGGGKLTIVGGDPGEPARKPKGQE